MTPVLYASENGQMVITPSPINIYKIVHIPQNVTFLYNNPYDIENQIYPNNIMKCEELTGEGTIFVDSYNMLVLDAHNLSNFKGHIYRSPFASLIVYTKTKNEDVKYTAWEPQIIAYQEEAL